MENKKDCKNCNCKSNNKENGIKGNNNDSLKQNDKNCDNSS